MVKPKDGAPEPLPFTSYTSPEGPEAKGPEDATEDDADQPKEQTDTTGPEAENDGVHQAQAERESADASAAVPSTLPGEVGAEVDPVGPGPAPARSAPQNPEAKMSTVGED